MEGDDPDGPDDGAYQDGAYHDGTEPDEWDDDWDDEDDAVDDDADEDDHRDGFDDGLDDGPGADYLGADGAEVGIGPFRERYGDTDMRRRPRAPHPRTAPRQRQQRSRGGRR